MKERIAAILPAAGRSLPRRYKLWSHVLAWTLLALLLTFLEMRANGFSFWFSFTNTLVSIAIYVVVVYFNVYYLIPHYLKEKKFFTYLGLLVLAVVTVTPLKTIVLYFKWAHLPQLQAELLREMNLYFVPTFLIAVTSTFISIVSDWASHLRREHELQTKTMQTELNFLKSQINPHFLFNTLNNLYALTLKKDPRAPEIIIKLSEMMRYMLYECNEKRVPLQKEVHYIRNYLDLERLRQGDGGTISFEVKGDLRDQQIAPLMFIPFLENAFKHGLNNQLATGFVRAELRVNGNHITFFIENSKADALPGPTLKRSGGIGLANVRRRLELLYPGRYKLDIDDRPNTWAVTLELELD